jgi:hypothetical protein
VGHGQGFYVGDTKPADGAMQYPVCRRKSYSGPWRRLMSYSTLRAFFDGRWAVRSLPPSLTRATMALHVHPIRPLAIGDS